MTDSQLRRSAARLSISAALPAVLLAAGLIGCGSKPEPEVAATKKFVPVDESASSANESEKSSPTSSSASFPNDTGGNARARARDTQAASGNTQPESGGTQPESGGKTGSPPSPELQQILEQLDRLALQQPKGSNPREQVEDFVRIHSQRLTLAKQALAKNPSSDLKRRLAMAMNEVYERFLEFGVPSAMSQFADFGKTMAADKDPELARLGRHAQFTVSLARIRSQPDPDGTQGKQIAAEAIKLLEAEKGHLSDATLQLLGEVADHLTTTGATKDSVGLIETIADTLAADPRMAERASQYRLTAKLIKSDLNALLTAVAKDEPGADDKIKTAMRDLVTDIPPGPALLRMAQDVPRMLETFGRYQAAQECYDMLAAAFEKSGDARLTEEAKSLVQKAKQRMSLVGQPLTVEGVRADGSPFDWSAYQGKVVLVDFWATWCGPCLEELPNIRQNFEQFHAKGFEVVGVNLDTAAADLKQFLALQGQEIPWATVTSQVVLDGKAGDDWSQIPMAAKCGVQAIPFVVLIGKDGNVDSIHVRGAKLGARLKALLGDPVTTEVPADPTQPAKTPAKPATGQLRRLAPFAIAAVSSLLFADPPATADDDSSNPYLAKPGLNSSQLVAFVQKMLDRPQAIQSRPGFADAIVDACDRVQKGDGATSAEQLFAVQTKLATLHHEACDGKEAADKQLMEFVAQIKDDERKEIAREVAFFRLERRAIEAKELSIDEIPSLLKDVKDYMAQEKLGAKHLRLASSTVAAINRLESGEEREKLFAVFGKIFSNSSDQELARYGKKLAKAKN